MPSADGTIIYPLETPAENFAGRRWPEAGPSHIPNWVYTDPEIFAREQERIFAGAGWLYVCLEAEISNPGDFTRSRLGTREVVAVRDPSGEVNVLLNRCAHRSAQLCSATRGTAKEIVCPYHQWTYDLGGKLLGVPFRRGYHGQGGMPADFRLDEHGLQRLAVTRRHGVVFASFSKDTEPLERWHLSTHYSLGDQVLDSSGNVQTVIQVSGASDSGSIEPVWTAGGETVHTADNDLHWQNTGPGPEGILITAKGILNPFLQPGDAHVGGSYAINLPLAAGIDTQGYFWACYDIQNGASNHFYAVQFDATTFVAVTARPTRHRVPTIPTSSR